MTLACGYGVLKTSSYHSKFGCAEEDQYGFLVQEVTYRISDHDVIFLILQCLTCTEDTPAARVTVAALQTSLVAYLPLCEITNESLKHGLMMSIKSSSTQENRLPDLSIWVIFLSNCK